MLYDLQKNLINVGAEIVTFADLSDFPARRAGYPSAVLVGARLTISKNTSESAAKKEVAKKETFTDHLADLAAGWLRERGISALSQSEERNMNLRRFDYPNQAALLPHKTIARLAGMGWIGRNNLLVTPQYGCAVSMATVLTVLLVPENPPIESDRCGDCRICVDACPAGALSGRAWNPDTSRDEMLAFKQCTSCLRCLQICPRNR